MGKQCDTHGKPQKETKTSQPQITATTLRYMRKNKHAGAYESAWWILLRKPISVKGQISI